jgi:hypothetical protein
MIKGRYSRYLSLALYAVSVTGLSQTSSAPPSSPSPNEMPTLTVNSGEAGVPDELRPGIAELPLITDVVRGRQAIPYSEATVIFEGTIQARQPRLVDGAVTTTLQASVDTSLKAPPENLPEIISFERYGGNLQYPSGHVQVYRGSGEHMPVVNGKYVFFVSGSPGTGYQLLTAYRISGQKVYPLDDPSEHSVYQQYNGVPLSTLLSAIQAKAASEPTK